MMTFGSIPKILYLSYQQSVAFINPSNQKYFPRSETHKNLGAQLRLSAKIQRFKVSDKSRLNRRNFIQISFMRIIQDSRFRSIIKMTDGTAVFLVYRPE